MSASVAPPGKGSSVTFLIGGAPGEDPQLAAAEKWVAAQRAKAGRWMTAFPLAGPLAATNRIQELSNELPPVAIPPAEAQEFKFRVHLLVLVARATGDGLVFHGALRGKGPADVVLTGAILSQLSVKDPTVPNRVRVAANRGGDAEARAWAGFFDALLRSPIMGFILVPCGEGSSLDDAHARRWQDLTGRLVWYYRNPVVFDPNGKVPPRVVASGGTTSVGTAFVGGAPVDLVAGNDSFLPGAEHIA
jgi:hypothetical protein